jgi:uncharacterized protein (DUF608 family)
MTRYRHSEKVKSGVPLGGIGAGKIEILPNGAWSAFTFMNNWAAPTINPRDAEQGRALGVLGFHFAAHVRSRRKTETFLLQTEKIAKYPRVDAIDYEGRWPAATLHYRKKGSPVTITLEAFGPVHPADPDRSARPAACFRFTARNAGREPVEVTLLGMLRNMIGVDEIGRYNRLEEKDGVTSIIAAHARPMPDDVTTCEYALSTPSPRGRRVAAMTQWNLQTEHMRFDADCVRLAPLDDLMKSGRIDPQGAVPRGKALVGGGASWGGALAVTGTIRPGAAKNVDFTFAWHAPKHFAGHRYERLFRSAAAAGRTAVRDLDRTRRALQRWRAALGPAGLPAWLEDALWNNLYVLSSTTWWDRAGDFAFFEAPVICPLMGTLDVRYYATVPFARLFPELEKKEMLLFAEAQRPNGYIPHDLGRNRLDNPNDGTTHYYWKDLNPKFVLLVDRDVHWLKDRRFLERIYPATKKAFLWSLSTDKNGDHLPDNEGADQTYDVWEFFGTNSYTSSIFLASCLAFERLALAMNDRSTARLARAWFEAGRKSFIDQLWNGRFFVAGWCEGTTYPASIAGQLNGQWYAHMTGLGDLFPGKMARAALRAMIALNGRDSKYGVTNSVFPDGRRDTSNAHSSGIWPGESYAVAALAIYEGLEREGLSIARKTWENMTLHQKNPWNQPDVIRSHDGSFGFGDAYMRNMAIWAVAEALAARHPKIRRALERFYRGG